MSCRKPWAHPLGRWKAGFEGGLWHWRGVL